MPKHDLPEFTAEELNELRRRVYGVVDSKKLEYNQKCLRIVEDHESGEIRNYTDVVVRWLYGIKSGLRE